MRRQKPFPRARRPAMSLPSSVEPTALKLSSAFSARIAPRFVALMVGLILSRGRPTITAALRAAGPLARGHFSTYHRVFSRASWSTWLLGYLLAAIVVELLPLDALIPVSADDTTAEHKGRRV